ncbi:MULTISPECIES: hypothetical protein [Amycolatopsis]|uniref:Phage r1t holin n=2 Tax=Amycolatopsis TaxID=1813 RepID=A0A1I3VL66_9PSEU|nr:hypothetical protein [Amycolatopsis sacchari]SFJ95902.1 phage r1t holin [Amycolatopsis sacchari]
MSVRWKAILSDFAERAGWSAGQVFFATLLAGGTAITVANLPWGYASAQALGAAVASVLLTTVQYLPNLRDPARWHLRGAGLFWGDLAVRLAKTFLASLAGSVAAATPFHLVRFDWTAALNVAGLAVLTALAKGLLARGSGTEERTPSTLPTATYLEAVRS